MSLLPENKPTEVDLTPKMFIFRGNAMTGKTYNACEFPVPLLINTDGNHTKVPTPSIYINDSKYKTATEKLLALTNILNELYTTTTPYKTIIIDLIEDVDSLCVDAVLEKYHVEALGDVKGYGTGWKLRETYFNNIVKILKLLTQKYYVVLTTHTIQKAIDDTMVTLSMLKPELYNNLAGQADMEIDCKKIGSTYMAKVYTERNKYDTLPVQEQCNQEIIDIIKDYKY